jgi:hypothetical protein
LEKVSEGKRARPIGFLTFKVILTLPWSSTNCWRIIGCGYEIFSKAAYILKVNCSSKGLLRSGLSS